MYLEISQLVVIIITNALSKLGQMRFYVIGKIRMTLFPCWAYAQQWVLHLKEQQVGSDLKLFKIFSKRSRFLLGLHYYVFRSLFNVFFLTRSQRSTTQPCMSLTNNICIDGGNKLVLLCSTPLHVSAIRSRQTNFQFTFEMDWNLLAVGRFVGFNDP